MKARPMLFSKTTVPITQLLSEEIHNDKATVHQLPEPPTSARDQTGHVNVMPAVLEYSMESDTEIGKELKLPAITGSDTKSMSTTMSASSSISSELGRSASMK